MEHINTEIYHNDDGEVLVRDYLDAIKARMKSDYEKLKYLILIYGGDKTLDELYEEIKDYLNKH